MKEKGGLYIDEIVPGWHWVIGGDWSQWTPLELRSITIRSRTGTSHFLEYWHCREIQWKRMSPKALSCIRIIKINTPEEENSDNQD